MSRIDWFRIDADNCNILALLEDQSARDGKFSEKVVFVCIRATRSCVVFVATVVRRIIINSVFSFASRVICVYLPVPASGIEEEVARGASSIGGATVEVNYLLFIIYCYLLNSLH